MANRGMPSLLALLGLVAAAGFQHRDKLGQILGQSGLGQPGSGQSGLGNSAPRAGEFGDKLNSAGDVLGRTASDVGGSLMSGLNELLETFRSAGNRDQADSWITPGVPTQTLSREQVEASIGRDTLTDLARDTGMDYDDLLDRLAKTIPEAVDRATPDGHFPQSDDEVRERLAGL
jgi:uncharacterized protein YidB (DUF937 family)